MTALIKDHALAENQWQQLSVEDASQGLPLEGKIIISLTTWQELKESLKGRGNIGLFLDSSDEVEAVAEDLVHFEMVAINFPKFADGRGYSLARLLRDRYNFTGEVRAVGDVLHDQLFYMQRCGFNAFEIRADRDAESALSGLSDFSEVYQDGADNRLPLFRRR